MVLSDLSLWDKNRNFLDFYGQFHGKKPRSNSVEKSTAVEVGAVDFRRPTANTIPNCTVWKFENFSPTIFLQKFHQINFFTKVLYCKLIWRNLFEVGVNFRHFHTVNCELYVHSLEFTHIFWQTFRENNVFVTSSI